ncbi:hypothetical protein, partial [Escherichia coli]
KGEALEIPHSPEKEPVSCLTDWHYSARWLFFYLFCQVICLLSQAIYLQPRHNDHPVTEYYIATFTRKN